MIKLRGNGPVIVVDDDSDALRIARAVFEISSISNSLLLQRSGTELLSYLELVEHQQAEMPSIVLLDVNMSELDGFSTLRRIRQRDAFRRVPAIVMLTASNDARDLQRAEAEGADGYQVKPFELQDFVSFVNSLAPAG